MRALILLLFFLVNCHCLMAQDVQDAQVTENTEKDDSGQELALSISYRPGTQESVESLNGDVSSSQFDNRAEFMVHTTIGEPLLEDLIGPVLKIIAGGGLSFSLEPKKEGQTSKSDHEFIVRGGANLSILEKVFLETGLDATLYLKHIHKKGEPGERGSTYKEENIVDVGPYAKLKIRITDGSRLYASVRKYSMEGVAQFSAGVEFTIK